MQFEIEIGSRLRKVSVHRKDGSYLVTVDGTSHLVDAARIDGSTLSLLVRDGDGAPARSHEASVVAQALPGAYDVHVAGRLIPLQVRAGSGLGRRRDGAAAAGSGPQKVTAPMPGKVVRVLVRPGDAVTPRQGLVVVEAMKMENELRAAREGRVKTVAVTEGQSVESGALLVVVE